MQCGRMSRSRCLLPLVLSLLCFIHFSLAEQISTEDLFDLLVPSNHMDKEETVEAFPPLSVVEHYAFMHYVVLSKPKRKTDGEENRGSQKLPRLAAAKIGHYTIRPKLDL